MLHAYNIHGKQVDTLLQFPFPVITPHLTYMRHPVGKKIIKKKSSNNSGSFTRNQENVKILLLVKLVTSSKYSSTWTFWMALVLLDHMWKFPHLLQGVRNVVWSLTDNKVEDWFITRLLSRQVWWHFSKRIKEGEFFFCCLFFFEIVNYVN